VLRSLANAFLKVESKVSGANRGSFLGIVILVEKIYVI